MRANGTTRATDGAIHSVSASLSGGHFFLHIAAWPQGKCSDTVDICDSVKVCRQRRGRCARESALRGDLTALVSLPLPHSSRPALKYPNDHCQDHRGVAHWTCATVHSNPLLSISRNAPSLYS
jgi:hypothetical protein